jgi:hypothetical protein
MSATELSDFIVAECQELCRKLASLKPYVEVAFERLDAGETICGYTSKTAFCENVLGRTYNAVKFMLAGGNPRNARKVFNEIQTEVLAALIDQGCQHREAVSLVESAQGQDFNSLFKSALAKRSGITVVPDSSPDSAPAPHPTPVPATSTVPAADNVNLLASELIRDLDSTIRLDKLKAVVESRQRLNPTLWRDLLRVLKNIANFGEQLSEDFEEIPNNGKAFQRIVRERMAMLPEPDLDEKKRLAADFTNASVREISYDEAKTIILQYEYLGSMNASTKYSVGLYFGPYLAGAECFGSTGGANVAESVCGPEHADKVITLVRGACTGLWAHPNSASYLITRACNLMADKGYHIIVAYADPRGAEEGRVYRNINWKYCGMTSPTEQFTTPDGRVHDNRQISGLTRDRTGGGLRYTRSWAEQKQLLIDQGCTFFMGEAKHRYVGFYGDRRIRGVLQKALRWEILPYPKRSTGVVADGGDQSLAPIPARGNK